MTFTDSDSATARSVIKRIAFHTGCQESQLRITETDGEARLNISLVDAEHLLDSLEREDFQP